MSDAAFFGQGAGSFGVFARVLQVEVAVAHRIPVLQDAVISGRHIDAEPLAKEGKIAQRIEQVALGLRQIFHGHLVTRAPQERLGERAEQMRGQSSAGIAAQVAEKIRREGSGQPRPGAQEDISQALTVDADAARLRQLVADHGNLSQSSRIAWVGNGIDHRHGGDVVAAAGARRKNRRKLMPGQGQSQSRKKQLFLLVLIETAVVDRNVQRLFQRDDTRCPLHFALRPQEFLDVACRRQAVQRKRIGLLHREMFVHVLDERSFLLDDAIGLLVRRLAVMLGRASGQN